MRDTVWRCLPRNRPVSGRTDNILVVLGLPGLIAPGSFMPELLTRDDGLVTEGTGRCASSHG